MNPLEAPLYQLLEICGLENERSKINSRDYEQWKKGVKNT